MDYGRLGLIALSRVFGAALAVFGAALFAGGAFCFNGLLGDGTNPVVGLLFVVLPFWLIGGFCIAKGVASLREDAERAVENGRSLIGFTVVIGFFIAIGICIASTGASPRSVKTVVAGVLAVFWALIACCNFSIAWLTWVRKVERPPSMIPLIGTAAGLFAVALAPIESSALRWAMRAAVVALDLSAGELLFAAGMALLMFLRRARGS